MTTDPHILHDGVNSLVLALSDTEAGKMILPSTLVFTDAATGEVLTDLPKPDIEKEAAKLQYANRINGLLPKFIRMQPGMARGVEHPMMVMERLYPLPTHHFDLPTRREMMAQLQAQLHELHRHGFLHGDLARPTHYYNRYDMEWIFGNIVQTAEGLRLIDAGFALLRSEERDLGQYAIVEMEEVHDLKYFKTYYLGKGKEPDGQDAQAQE